MYALAFCTYTARFDFEDLFQVVSLGLLFFFACLKFMFISYYFCLILIDHTFLSLFDKIPLAS